MAHTLGHRGEFVRQSPIRHQKWGLIFVVLVAAIIVPSYAYEFVGSVHMDYRFRVVGQYDVCKIRDNGDGIVGRFVLAQNYGRDMWTPLVYRLESFGVSEETVFGKSQEGYFILTFTNEQNFLSVPHVVHYPSKKEWQSALEKLGIIEIPELLNPEHIAATREAIELRPWEYYKVDRFLGISREGWVLISLGIGLGTSVVLGLKLRSSLVVLGTTAILGIVIGFFVDIIAIEGIPAICSWPFMFPGTALVCKKIKASIIKANTLDMQSDG